jgi:hypothetical protein
VLTGTAAGLSLVQHSPDSHAGLNALAESSCRKCSALAQAATADSVAARCKPLMV